MIRAAALLALIATQSPALDIRRDMGGAVDAYAAEIAAARGQVRIVGECVSACTMWLSVACVSPRARLGFHGPHTASGLPLPRREFDRLTRVMAGHYPTAIADWFMAEGRMNTGAPAYITGAEAIRLGAVPCYGAL